MTDVPTEFRLTTLEVVIADLAASVAQTTRNVNRLSLEMKDFKDEMADFKNEMRDFKDEMSDFKNEMRDFKDEMSDFKDEMSDFKNEMRDFKDEMSDFKDEMRQETRKLNLELGRIANKQGRMAEDLVAPSIGRILRQVENYPESMPTGCMVRVRITHPNDPSRVREFDTIATCGEHVLINETKSSLRTRDVDKVQELIPEVLDFFPLFKGKKIICSVATLHVDSSLVTYATRNGILVLAVGDELMDVMNPQGFKPREFLGDSAESFSHIEQPADEDPCGLT